MPVFTFSLESSDLKEIALFALQLGTFIERPIVIWTFLVYGPPKSFLFTVAVSFGTFSFVRVMRRFRTLRRAVRDLQYTSHVSLCVFMQFVT